MGAIGGIRSLATGINDVGQVVGFSDPVGGGYAHAFRTSANGVIGPDSDLGTLGVGISAARRINASANPPGNPKPQVAMEPTPFESPRAA